MDLADAPDGGEDSAHDRHIADQGGGLSPEYVVVDPHHTVVFTWGLQGSDILPVGSSRVEFHLTPIAVGTRVDLLHTDLPEDQLAPHAQGWPRFLAALATALAPAPA